MVRRVIGAVGRFCKRLPLNLVYRWPKAGARRLWLGLRAASRGAKFAAQWAWGDARFYSALFIYTSRRFLRVEGYLALTAIILWFGFMFMSSGVKGGQIILNTYYSAFTIAMILIAMSLLPRERDEGTLEILWSQPFPRGGIILIQLFSLTAWLAIIMFFMGLFFGSFLSSEAYFFWVAFFALTTAFAVALITVLIATFCRNAIATGVVAILIFGIHIFWIREIGPINLYFNPLPSALAIRRDISIGACVANRVFLLILLGFVYDYLLRRLRHSAPWFT